MYRDRLRTLLVGVGLLVALVGSGCMAPVMFGAATAGAAASGTSSRQREKKGPAKSQLEIRQMQQQTFETTDTKQVFMAVMNTLQDDGFVVRQAQLDVGLLNGAKSVDVAEASKVFSSTFFAAMTGGQAKYANNAVVEVSVNVAPHAGGTRVRANFENKVFDNSGAVWNSEVIEEEAFYTEFFSKVSKAVFIEQEKL
jgi:hypothetical protein